MHSAVFFTFFCKKLEKKLQNP